VTIYPSLTAFLVAIGPYVTDQGQLVQWQDQGQQLYGLQAKANPQEVFALRLGTLLQELGVSLYTLNMQQRKTVDIWMRMVTGAVSDPNGEYLYGLLIFQASSRATLLGDSFLSASLSRTRSLTGSLPGDSFVYADATVVP
jgi:hypothetical protein